jgi:hypothetical protein
MECVFYFDRVNTFHGCIDYIMAHPLTLSRSNKLVHEHAQQLRIAASSIVEIRHKCIRDHFHPFSMPIGSDARL